MGAKDKRTFRAMPKEKGECPFCEKEVRNLAKHTGKCPDRLIPCAECSDGHGEWKAIYSREFKRAFGIRRWRKATERKPLCLSCIYTLFEGGGLAGWFPAYIRKAKRINKTYYNVNPEIPADIDEPIGEEF
jgi:hypothetical protein